MSEMQICPNTSLSIPECACPLCLERQLDQFAPQRIRVRRLSSHDPLRLDEVRSPVALPPVSVRLNRPVL
jgi:hypothetical protein